MPRYDFDATEFIVDGRSVSIIGGAGGGCCEPLTTGDPDNPELLFDGHGDILMMSHG